MGKFPIVSLPAPIAEQLHAILPQFHTDISFHADITLRNDYGSEWVCADESGIVVIRDDGITVLVRDDLERVTIRKHVSGGRLTARYEGETLLLAVFSATRTESAREFATRANQVLIADGAAEGVAEPPESAAKADAVLGTEAHILSRLFSLLPRQKLWRLPVIALALAGGAGAAALSPILTGSLLFDQVLDPSGRFAGMLLMAVGAILLARLVEVGMRITWGLSNATLIHDLEMTLKRTAFAALQRMPMGFFGRHHTGELMTHLEQDASDLALLFHFVLPTAIHSAIFLLASLAAMLLLNWQLALVAILPFPILYFVLSRIEPEVRSYYNRMFRAEADLRVAASDSLVGARVIRAFGQEQQELDRFDKPNRSAARLGFLADATAGTARPPMEFVTELVLVCVWAGGAWALVHDQVSIGLLITFAGYLGRFFGPVGSLIELVQYWARASTGANRLFNLIDTGVRNERPNPQSDDSRIRGEIGLEGVSFSYTAGQPVLLSVDLRAAPGEMIGVVGHTGAGKSTLINLLARLYSPDEGVIRIDGRDIRDLDSASLRGQIGVVLQDTYLFLGSVRDNIAYARPDASLEEVMAAATAADAHDFIVRMPDGYDTVLGPRGIGLSGGQRQRLGIARALLLDPPLLLMDEATSSVDTETELRIQRAIERLVENRTTVIIAHRLSTLRLTSRLYVLDRGRVAETGTHSELIQAGGPYQQLVERQRRALHVIGVGE